ncbi:TonB-dependent siderophore receptor [Frateuria aurantia]
MTSRCPLFVATALACATAQLYATAPETPQRHKGKPHQLQRVEVHAAAAQGYQASLAQFSSFGSGPLHSTPASINVLPRALIDDRQPRTVSELTRNDASVGDSYAAVGYYQDVSIRGFPLDLATGFRLNGMTTNGEQILALENVQQVEISKGIAGLEAGVVSPGGSINYVTKRVQNVQTITTGTDSHGSRYTALDLGRWITPNFGVRFNTAYDGTHSYIQHDPGRRNFYALAIDWLISDRAKLQLDVSDQTNSQRSASGYQLLGGTRLPQHVDWTRMLGYEPWQLPVRIHAFDATARFNYRFTDHWTFDLAYGHSRSVIDDNVAYAYGCSTCARSNFFAANGDYDIYDWRSPDDTRQNDELRAQLQGQIQTGPLQHHLSVGVDGFRRLISQRDPVYNYVGSANISQDNPPYYPISDGQPGPPERALDSWQRSIFAMDRIEWGAWSLLAGGRYIWLNESAYDTDGVLERHTTLSRALPQTAIMWQPTTRLTTYLSYSKGLQLGNQAPWWTSNANVYLAPLITRQLEAGIKYAATDTLDLGLAVYRMSEPFQYARPDQSPEGYTFVQQGTETHTGLELTANGQITPQLRIFSSVSLIHARASNTGTPAYEGHQLQNVPLLRSNVYLDYQLPVLTGLSLSGGWRYTSPNAATPGGSPRVPAYNLFDLGIGYRLKIHGHALGLRLSVDNLFNHFYWQDTGSSGGDSFLFPGEPRLARLTATYAF